MASGTDILLTRLFAFVTEKKVLSQLVDINCHLRFCTLCYCHLIVLFNFQIQIAMCTT